jgi:hypothetical protein
MYFWMKAMARELILAKCQTCEIKFQRKYEYRIEKYCSKECWSNRGSYRRKTCIGCGKIGLGKWSKIYCSRQCAHKQTEGKANAYKGKKAGYSAIHKWVTAHFGKPQICFHCGTKGKRMHWSNIDHKYTRERNDWIELCAKCHAWFDKGDPHYCSVILKRWEDFTGKTAILSQ